MTVDEDEEKRRERKGVVYQVELRSFNDILRKKKAIQRKKSALFPLTGALCWIYKSTLETRIRESPRIEQRQFDEKLRLYDNGTISFANNLRKWSRRGSPMEPCCNLSEESRDKYRGEAWKSGKVLVGRRIGQRQEFAIIERYGGDIFPLAAREDARGWKQIVYGEIVCSVNFILLGVRRSLTRIVKSNGNSDDNSGRCNISS